MDVRMSESKEKNKILIMVILLAIAVLLTYYFHAVLRIGILFTHFYYIPILLAALWWKRKGLIVPIFLAGLLILSDVLFNMPTYEDIVRGLMLIAIGYIIAVLSETIAKSKIPVMVILLSIAFMLTYYCHVVLKIGVLFTHFFYIPIILASLWWKRKGLTVAFILAGMLILSDVFLKVSIYDDLVRGLMFIVIGSIVALLSEIIEKSTNELRESEAKYRTLFDSSSDAIMLIDDKGFFDCNNATLRIFGFSNKKDFIKMHLSQVCPPYQPDGVDSHTAANNKLAEAFKNGSNHFEWVHRKNNGEDFSADVLLTAFEFKGKQVLQATVRDITEKKRMEELYIENERLKQESKVKSEFLTTMSHELRTPLNAIIGFSDILMQGMGGNLNEIQKSYAGNIHNAGEHLLHIIDDILDLSIVEAGRMELAIEKFSMQELLEETFTLIRDKALNHNINIIRDIDSQLEFMDGDKQKIKKVLFNLMINAVKFSKEEGGTITVAVKKTEGRVSFSVSDNGIGIETKNLDKLFKEFQQLDSGINRKYGGTGLGLVISKKLVELHGGEIRAQSVYGEGSTFTFTLPYGGKERGCHV